MNSLVQRVIGRMYSLKCVNIVLELKRTSGIGSLCSLSGKNNGCENLGHVDLGRNAGL